MKRVLGLLLACAACGPSPRARPPAPGGTLVVVVRQGPDRVPFHPTVARIQSANAQLAGLLGHAITIEVDGALLPQTHEGAEELLAHLVEDVAADVHAIAKEDAGALAYTQTHFQHLVVRYDPAEAARRRTAWRARAARLDLTTDTVDVVRAEARWLALDAGEIGGVFHEAVDRKNDARYARTSPLDLPAGERRAWLTYHAHGGRADAFAGIDLVGLRGALALARQDPSLAADARAWIFDRGLGEMSGAYHHRAAELEAAGPGSPFRVAEGELVAFLRTTSLSPEERAKVAEKLWVIDFRKSGGDRFATYAWPGLDPMAFSFAIVDAWMAAGHPWGPRVFDLVVAPVLVEPRNGEPHFSTPSRSDGMWYRWAFADRGREDVLARGVLERNDVPFATAAFVAAHRELRDEGRYLRLMQRFEGAPALWKVAADVDRESAGGTVSALHVEEAKRLWRDVPAARGHALYWFAVESDHSYHPAADWKENLQGRPVDRAALDAYLALGWSAFSLLPSVWPVLPKRDRVAPVVAVAPALLDAKITPYPGRRDVAGTLADLARKLCEERSPEIGELRAWAQAELPRRPGAGLAEVVGESACKKAP